MLHSNELHYRIICDSEHCEMVEVPSSIFNWGPFKCYVTQMGVSDFLEKSVTKV